MSDEIEVPEKSVFQISLTPAPDFHLSHLFFTLENFGVEPPTRRFSSLGIVLCGKELRRMDEPSIEILKKGEFIKTFFEGIQIKNLIRSKITEISGEYHDFGFDDKNYKRFCSTSPR